MLVLPDHGFQPSVKSHNVRLDALVDWIEGSVAFIDVELSQPDVVDVLCENMIYREQAFASERVSDAWIELDRRSSLLASGSAFEVDGRVIRRVIEWDVAPTYSFCVFLGLQTLFRSWAGTFGADYTVQGELFEKLTVESLEQLGWSVFRTGWSPGAAGKIADVVMDVGNRIGEESIPAETAKWLSKQGNEAGLDVVCFDPFDDGWGGRPIFFFQCATGANWTDKLHTPNTETWRKVISFTTVPQRGFATPFGFLESEFRRYAGEVNGMFMDRYRLQWPATDGDHNWLSTELKKDILKWMRPRVKKLPDGSE